MRKLSLFVVLVLVLCACDQTNGKDSESDQQDSEQLVVEIDPQLIKDSLVDLQTVINKELVELKKPFDFKQDDFDGKTYCHKNWWGSYYISDEAILAGVDSSGNFFLIANVWGYSHRNRDLNFLEITVDTTNYKANSDTSMTTWDSQTMMCACGFHQAFFTSEEARLIGREFSENSNNRIKWKGMKVLTNRNKTGVKDSYDLSEKIKQLAAVERQIIEINEKIIDN